MIRQATSEKNGPELIVFARSLAVLAVLRKRRDISTFVSISFGNQSNRVTSLSNSSSKSVQTLDCDSDRDS